MFGMFGMKICHLATLFPPIKGLPKCTKIGIFGMKICHLATLFPPIKGLPKCTKIGIFGMKVCRLATLLQPRKAVLLFSSLLQSFERGCLMQNASILVIVFVVVTMNKDVEKFVRKILSESFLKRLYPNFSKIIKIGISATIS
jgi:hypothetical protein